MSAPCGAAERCAAWDPDAEGPAEVAPGARLCEPDLRLAARDLGALVRDYAELECRLPASGGGPGPRVAGRREPPVPLDLGVDALQRSIAFTVTAWEPVVREAARLSPEQTRGVRAGWAVATAVTIMAPRTALISTLGPQMGFWDGWGSPPTFQDGLGALRGFQRLHGRARALLGLTRLVHRMPGPCSGCGCETLRRTDGSPEVHCATCGQRWTHDAYRRYVGLILDALGA